MRTGDYVQQPPVQQPKLVEVPGPNATGDDPQQAMTAGMAKMQDAQKLPQGAGYSPGAGKAAYFANNLLTGWMAGRHMAEAKKLKDATTEVSSLYGLYQNADASFSRLVDAGTKEKAEQKTADGKLLAEQKDPQGNPLNREAAEAAAAMAK